MSAEPFWIVLLRNTIAGMEAVRQALGNERGSVACSALGPGADGTAATVAADGTTISEWLYDPQEFHLVHPSRQGLPAAVDVRRGRDPLLIVQEIAVLARQSSWVAMRWVFTDWVAVGSCGDLSGLRARLLRAQVPHRLLRIEPPNWWRAFQSVGLMPGEAEDGLLQRLDAQTQSEPSVLLVGDPPSHLRRIECAQMLAGSAAQGGGAVGVWRDVAVSLFTAAWRNLTQDRVFFYARGRLGLEQALALCAQREFREVRDTSGVCWCVSFDDVLENQYLLSCADPRQFDDIIEGYGPRLRLLL